jgi:hypothetical protein
MGSCTRDVGMDNAVSTEVVNSPPLLWEIVRQQVRGAGRGRMRGLRARVDIRRGDKITEFHTSGVFKTAEEAKVDDYFVIQATTNNFVRLTNLDGRKNMAVAYDNKVGNLANHAPTSRANSKMCPSFRNGVVTVSLRATKKISKGQHILQNYGNKTWMAALRARVEDNKRQYPNLRQGAN